MPQHDQVQDIGRSSRRGFLKQVAVPAVAGSLAAGLDLGRCAHAAGSDVIRIGMIGCGNRGTGACREALLAPGAKKLVAVGDLFPERIESSLKNLQKYDDLAPNIDVPTERQFVGFDAYQQVLAAGVDMVLLATPPHFRPIHYAAAVQAGKHVFMEKPCCVDAPGYRALVAANTEAKLKKLSVVVGLQRRHQRNYLDGIQRIRDGAIGDVIYLRTYYNVQGGGRSGQLKPEGMSELEYQIRHWGVFLWLSGDHIVEQATHLVDVANWVLDAHPVRANGMGGRELRFGPGNGDIWDHHAIEFEYENGVRYYLPGEAAGGHLGTRFGERPRHPGLADVGHRRLGFRELDAARTPRQETRGGEPLSTGTRRSGPQHPRRRTVLLRHRLRRHKQYDGGHGPHGHVLRPGDHLGGRDTLRVATRPGPLRLGCRAARETRRQRRLRRG